jgi:hypothetical protein
MKKLTIEGFEAMTSKAKTELIKKHLGLDVGSGWKICGHSYRRIIVGLDTRGIRFGQAGWTSLYSMEVILAKHKYYLYATPAAIDAINKKNSTSKTD